MRIENEGQRERSEKERVTKSRVEEPSRDASREERKVVTPAPFLAIAHCRVLLSRQGGERVPAEHSVDRDRSRSGHEDRKDASARGACFTRENARRC